VRFLYQAESGIQSIEAERKALRVWGAAAGRPMRKYATFPHFHRFYGPAFVDTFLSSVYNMKDEAGSHPRTRLGWQGSPFLCRRFRNNIHPKTPRQPPSQFRL
jgi:hypothetical protein